MEAVAFGSLYRDRSPTGGAPTAGCYDAPATGHRNLLPAAREWASWFGHILQERLCAPADFRSDIAHYQQELASYRSWTKDKLGSTGLLATLLPGLSQAEAQELEPLLRFHRLQGAMLGEAAAMPGLWSPIFNGVWSSHDERRKTMEEAADVLVWEIAAPLYVRRATLASTVDSTGNDYEYFSPQNSRVRSEIERMLSRVDLVIVAICALLRVDDPNLTIVPAPPLFEGAKPPHRVHFVVFDSQEQRAVGICIETKVDLKDPRRVNLDDPGRDNSNLPVVVSGNADFDSVKVAYTSPGSITLDFSGLSSFYRQLNQRQLHSIPWPGIVAARCFQDDLQRLPSEPSVPPRDYRKYREYQEEQENTSRVRAILDQDLAGCPSLERDMFATEIGNRIMTRL